MLRLNRYPDQSVVIRAGGQLIGVTIIKVRGRKVGLEFLADADVEINRMEIDVVRHPPGVEPANSEVQPPRLTREYLEEIVRESLAKAGNELDGRGNLLTIDRSHGRSDLAQELLDKFFPVVAENSKEAAVVRGELTREDGDQS